MSNEQFLTTHWSMVAAAGSQSSPETERALESLCETYWYPLYAFVRRLGKQPAEAQDLTQAFFAKLLEKDYLQAADQDKGRFRTFLLTIFQRFMANEHQRDAALKRGGGQTVLSFDFDDGERRLNLEPSHDRTAERDFERRWAMALLDDVLLRLEQDYATQGKAELFSRVKVFLTVGDADASYREISSELGLTETAVKVFVYRLRQRYRDMIRTAVSNTVAHNDDVEDELGCLLTAVRGN